MKLSDVLTKERIIINLNGKDKYDILEKLVNVARTSDKVINEADLLKKVIEREKIKSTGIGGGIGIPHAQTSGVTDIVACLGISEQGIEFNSLDSKPVYLVFLIATKERTNSTYLGLLSRIARLFIDESFKQRIIKSTSPDEIMNLILEKRRNKKGALMDSLHFSPTIIVFMLILFLYSSLFLPFFTLRDGFFSLNKTRLDFLIKQKNKEPSRFLM